MPHAPRSLRNCHRRKVGALETVSSYSTVAHTRTSSTLPHDVRSITDSGLQPATLRALANLAIELRGPLSVILGHSENIRQTADDDEAIRSIAAIEKSGCRIDRITSDILTLGALEHEIAQHQTASVTNSFQLQECVTDLRERLAHLIRDKRAALSVEISPSDCRLPGDHYFWFFALQHLLENALSENNRDLQITIAANHQADTITIEFIDNGIGIPPNDLGQVFFPFFRVRRDRSVAQRGIGLGLHYVRRLVDYHSGEITVSSIPGVRTSFRIVLSTAS